MLLWRRNRSKSLYSSCKLYVVLIRKPDLAQFYIKVFFRWPHIYEANFTWFQGHSQYLNQRNADVTSVEKGITACKKSARILHAYAISLSKTRHCLVNFKEEISGLQNMFLKLQCIKVHKRRTDCFYLGAIFAFLKWRNQSKSLGHFQNWTRAILDIFSFGYLHKRNAHRHVVRSLPHAFFVSTKFVKNHGLWLRSSLFLLNLCETVRSKRKIIFTGVKISAEEEIHRCVYANWEV